MTSPAPRRSIRALVTRPRDEAEGVAAALAARGIEAVIEPMMTIVPREAAIPDLAGVQAILCTSANGVRALARASAEREMPLFAVGDATAARARAEGFRRVESAGGNVDDLAALVSFRLEPSGGPLLHVAGTVVAGDLAGTLRAAGFTVERAALYAACEAAVLSEPTARRLDDGRIDLALFFSPRSAAIFARLAASAGVDRGLRGCLAVSISRAADAALGELRFRRRLVAAAPTQAALLALIDRELCESCA